MSDSHDLPHPWQAVFDENEQDTYYWNAETNETTWTKPTSTQSAGDVDGHDANADDTEGLANIMSALFVDNGQENDSYDHGEVASGLEEGQQLGIEEQDDDRPPSPSAMDLLEQHRKAERVRRASEVELFTSPTPASPTVVAAAAFIAEPPETPLPNTTSTYAPPGQAPATPSTNIRTAQPPLSASRTPITSSASKTAAGLQVAAIGAGGVNEMQKRLDIARVQFALCRFDVGSGTFSRAKHMLIHLTGDNCPAVRRGRGNAKKSEALSVFGMCHCELAISSPDECTVAAVLEVLRRACVSDDGVDAPSLEALKSSMEKFISDAQARAAAVKATKSRRMSDVSAAPPPEKPTAAALGVELQRAIRLVTAPNGAFNWVLVHNDGGAPALDDAGAGSVAELVNSLDDTKVQFGVMRLSFGKGRFRRTKWAFVHWAGAEASALRRGRDNAALGAIRPGLGPTSVDLHATSRDELTLQEVLDKVRKVFIVDGDLDADDAARLLSLEMFEEALQEDEEKFKEEFGIETGDDNAAEGAVDDDFPEEEEDDFPSLRDAVASVLDPDDPNNYVLVNAA